MRCRAGNGIDNIVLDICILMAIITSTSLVDLNTTVATTDLLDITRTADGTSISCWIQCDVIL